jgi:NTE family protein
MAAKRIGVALGGGGVRGLAHAPALQTIDACGIKPAAIAGTSMGAIIGALYASGISGDELVSSIETYTVKDDDSFKDVISKAPLMAKWLRVVSLDLRHGGLFKTDGFLKYFSRKLKAKTFEELEIPLYVVTTNFRTGEEVVFSSGELLPAIIASMAIPGIFAPVVIDGKVLVDGGLCNNVPYDILQECCDTTIAIDVAPARHSNVQKVPNMTDSVIGMFDLLVEKIVTEKHKQSVPDIYINTGIKNIRVLDFHKSKEVLEQAETPVKDLKSQLNKFLAEQTKERQSE